MKEHNLTELSRYLDQFKNPVALADGQSMVYVFGITGTGKSTMVSYLKGARYRWNDETSELQHVTTSRRQVCAVVDGGVSGTLIPTVVALQTSNPTHASAIVDFAGLGENRGGAERVTAALGPHIINSVAQQARNIWVISFNDTGARAKNLREALDAMVIIGGDCIEEFIASLTIVASKSNKGRDQNKNAIKKALKDVRDHVEADIKVVEKAPVFDQQEHQSLLKKRAMIWAICDKVKLEAVHEALPIHILDVEDNGLNATQLLQVVNQRQPINAQNLNFSCIDDQAAMFWRTMQTGLDAFKSMCESAKHCDAQITRMTQRKHILVNQNLPDIEQYQPDLLRTKIEVLAGQIDQLKGSIEVLKNLPGESLLGKQHVINIPAILKVTHENMLPYPASGIAVRDTQYHKAEYKKQIAEYEKHGVGFTECGYRTRRGGFRGGHKYYILVRPTTQRRVQVPVNNIQRIDFNRHQHENFPVTATFSPALNVTSSNGKNGYHGFAHYNAGQGLKVTVTYKALNKHLPANRAALAIKEAELAKKIGERHKLVHALKICETGLQKSREVINQHDVELQDVNEQLCSAQSQMRTTIKEVVNNQSLFDLMRILVGKLPHDRSLINARSCEFFIENLDELINNLQVYQDNADAHFDMPKAYVVSPAHSPASQQSSPAAQPRSSGSVPQAASNHWAGFFGQLQAHQPDAMMIQRIGRDNMIYEGALSLWLNMLLPNPQHVQLLGTIEMMGEQQYHQSAVERIQNALKTLPAGRQLLVPIHINGNHFTLLSLSNSAVGYYKATYLDSNSITGRAPDSVMLLCQALGIADDALMCFCRDYQSSMVGHYGGRQQQIDVSNTNNCAVFVAYFAQLLEHHPEAFANRDRLNALVQADGMDDRILSTLRRHEYARELVDNQEQLVPQGAHLQYELDPDFDNWVEDVRGAFVFPAHNH